MFEMEASYKVQIAQMPWNSGSGWEDADQIADGRRQTDTEFGCMGSHILVSFANLLLLGHY